MTEWKSMNPTSSSSQSSNAAMKNFLVDGRMTPLYSPPSPPIPHAQPGVGNGGGRRMRQGNTRLANITTMVEMQSKPLPLSPICPLPIILFSILSFIILWYIANRESQLEKASFNRHIKPDCSGFTILGIDIK